MYENGSSYKHSSIRAYPHSFRSL